VTFLKLTDYVCILLFMWMLMQCSAEIMQDDKLSEELKDVCCCCCVRVQSECSGWAWCCGERKMESGTV